MPVSPLFTKTLLLARCSSPTITLFLFHFSPPSSWNILLPPVFSLLAPLNPLQAGFCLMDFTQTSLSEIIDRLLSAKSNGLYSLILLALLAAFDTINPSLLLEALHDRPLGLCLHFVPLLPFRAHTQCLHSILSPQSVVVCPGSALLSRHLNPGWYQISWPAISSWCWWQPALPLHSRTLLCLPVPHHWHLRHHFHLDALLLSEMQTHYNTIETFLSLHALHFWQKHCSSSCRTSSKSSLCLWRLSPLIQSIVKSCCFFQITTSLDMILPLSCHCKLPHSCATNRQSWLPQPSAFWSTTLILGPPHFNIEFCN